MIYHSFPAPPQLSKYVRSFWVLEGDGPYIHRSMADGCAELVFHYKGVFDEITSQDKVESSFIAGLSGQSQVFRRFVTSEDFGIFGVYLYPYAIPQLFSIPATALSNQMPDCDSLLGNEGRLLTDKIFAANGNMERVKIIIAFIVKQLYKHEQKEQGILTVINKIVHSEGIIPVDLLAKSYFLSTRQFERKFKTFSGFSPKLFSRIVRFQASTRRYGNKQLSLTDIAYDCGYYDQAHFIHDFKEFSGFHPRQYFSGNNEGTLWKEGEG
ncbi:MAG: helix-turn-helix domain-containing protein [Ferruginibacter sp.]